MTCETNFVHVGDLARQMVMDFGPADPAPSKPARFKPANISPIIGDWCWRLHPGAPQGGFLYRVRHRSPDWYNLFVPPSYLRERLDYDPETGVLTWRDHVDLPQTWRTRYAGKPALTAKETDGYLHGKITVPGVGRVRLRAHRVAWAISSGYWPRDEIDHINRKRSDNRCCNLREATRTENSHNFSCDGFAGLNPAVGVGWYKSGKKWYAEITSNGKTRYLGTFTDLADAVRARCEAERLHGWPDRGVTVEERIARALARAAESEKPRGGS